jgi:hypothetical protein
MVRRFYLTRRLGYKKHPEEDRHGAIYAGYRFREDDVFVW